MDGERVLEELAKNSDKLIGAATKAGVAYVGYRSNNHWTGALVGLIGLRLAESNNLAAGVSGVATLTFLGLTNVVKQGVVGADAVTGTTGIEGNAPIWAFLNSTFFPTSPIDPGPQYPYNPAGSR